MMVYCLMVFKFQTYMPTFTITSFTVDYVYMQMCCIHVSTCVLHGNTCLQVHIIQHMYMYFTDFHHTFTDVCICHAVCTSFT